jgi:hypothetical protein
MIRMANGREGNVVDAEVYLTMLRDERRPKAGDTAISRPSCCAVDAGLALTWLAVHVIDETSSLRDANPVSLAASNAEIAVRLGDGCNVRPVRKRSFHLASEIVWNARSRTIEDGLEGRR